MAQSIERMAKINSWPFIIRLRLLFFSFISGGIFTAGFGTASCSARRLREAISYGKEISRVYHSRVGTTSAVVYRLLFTIHLVYIFLASLLDRLSVPKE
jgi:hypothetical protein